MTITIIDKPYHDECICGHHAEEHDLRSDGYEVCEVTSCMCMNYICGWSGR